MAPGLRSFLRSDFFRYILAYIVFYIGYCLSSGSHFIAALTILFLLVPFACGWFLQLFFRNRITRYLVFTTVAMMVMNLYFIQSAYSIDLTQNLGQTFIYIDGEITFAGILHNLRVSLIPCIGLLAANSAILFLTRRLLPSDA